MSIDPSPLLPRERSEDGGRWPQAGGGGLLQPSTPAPPTVRTPPPSLRDTSPRPLRESGEDRTSLLRLLTWLSPTFPVGSFSFSHGLERAIHDGWVHDAESLHDWLDGLIAFGGGWNDAVLLARAHAAADNPAGLREVADLAGALAISRERSAETMGQGAAFLAAARAWPEAALPALNGAAAYPVAVGATCAKAGIVLEDALIAYLHALAANLVSVALRAVPLGQTDGVATLARLEPAILAAAARAAASSLDDLGSAAFNSDLSALNHETQDVRLFIS